MHKKYVVLTLSAIFGLAALGLILLATPANGMCSGATPKSYQVVIQHDEVSTSTLRGHLCDKLTITNRDNKTREIAFGPHEDHVPYDGIAERFLNQNESFTITFNATGTYHWHDHLHDNIGGYFTVSK